MSLDTIKKIIQAFELIAGLIPGSTIYVYDFFMQNLFAGGSDIFKTLQDSKGKDLSDLLPRSITEHVLPLCLNVLKGSSGLIEYPYKDRIYIIVIAPLEINDDIEGGVIIFHDITESRESENEIISKDEIISRKNFELRHFADRISHKLRKPIVSIMGLANVINEDDLNEDTRKMINYIRWNARYLDRLTRVIVRRSNKKEIKNK
ncbi:MAG: histidine kinase dimerization/phospho-acceptor domain-containing protein [Microscillaceae bacterium]|nr:histidine kinase dimerization/phospho-acceptor domain-containing protein [Microscillaceae bacterium]